MKMGNCSVFEGIMFIMLLFASLPRISHQTRGSKLSVTDLHNGETYVMTGPNSFCYENSIVPSWRHTWTTIQVKVWSSKVFNVEIVDGEEQLQELEHFSVVGWMHGFIREQHNETTIHIDLYSTKTCFKIDPADTTKYTVKPTRRYNVYLFLVFLCGMLLFGFANSLSRSQTFFYSAGVSIGVFASLVFLVLVLARLFPRKSPFYVLLFGGLSFAAYAIQLAYRNLRLILQEYWHAALVYVGLVGFVSFALCYRYGPLTNEKNINILSWLLQLAGLLLVYSGIQIKQVAFAIIVAIVFTKNLEYPVSAVILTWRKIRRLFYWKPEPRHLLTEEEYREQGEEETRRALEELRRQCNSPEFSPWKMVSKLQSPQRFADFVEGSFHLMPNEVSVHAQEYGLGALLFDTDDDDGDNNEEWIENEDDDND